MALLAPSPLSAFEQQRLDRIAENRKRMEEMGVLETANNLMKSFRPAKPPAPKRKSLKERKERRSQPVRRSRRLSGAVAEFAELRDEEAVTYSDYEGGLDDILADGADIESMPEEKQEQFQEIRCGSTGRGSVYDSVAGITCHFCRQKKLCGEEGCPRCSRRSTTADCIGKSDCSRCHSATGRFCRACLLIRYGQTLETVREEMASGSWLCPHCYEDDHPDEGWMCNSSICMKRRGYKPTGIAIYDAQQRGFPSVAHWLQAQLRKRSTNPSSHTNSSSQASAESSDADAAAAAGNKAVRQPSKAKQAAAGKAGASKLQRSSSSSTSSCGDGDSSSAAAVEAPVTPMRGSESLPTPAAAQRVTRAVVKAAAAGGCVSSQDYQLGSSGGEAKRLKGVVQEEDDLLGGAGAARRSLRFKSKQ